MSIFEVTTPDFIEEGLSDWRRVNYFQVQRHEERIHDNVYGNQENLELKMGLMTIIYLWICQQSI